MTKKLAEQLVADFRTECLRTADTPPAPGPRYEIGCLVGILELVLARHPGAFDFVEQHVQHLQTLPTTNPTTSTRP